MASDIERARELLESEGYTCVLVNGFWQIFSRDRGVKPLLDFLDSGAITSGFSAADRVVGRAAAFLYVLLGASEVWAFVMSRGAVEVFDRFGITYSCDVLADAIINRAGDGLCPMESVVMEEDGPAEALGKIRERLAELRK